MGCLTLMAVGLGGCGPPEEGCDPNGLLDPPCRVVEQPFDVNVISHILDPSSCLFDLTASASGGKDGTYAMWGDLKARTWDSELRDYRPVPHPLPASSGIFGADRIKKDDAQFGKVDLEYFRGGVGEEVSVRLDFEYTTMDGGPPAEGDESVSLELKCQ